jgi:hypothetical protein
MRTTTALAAHHLPREIVSVEPTATHWFADQHDTPDRSAPSVGSPIGTQVLPASVVRTARAWNEPPVTWPEVPSWSVSDAPTATQIVVVGQLTALR